MSNHLYSAALIALFSLAACTAGKQARTATATPVSVLSYNIHHANPPSVADKIDIDAIARVIADAKPDLVALQEVDVHTTRSGSGLHQAEELAKRAGMKAFFAKGIDYAGGEYGIAVLSKYPVIDTKRYALTTLAGTGGEPRALATVLVELPGGKRVLMACTHLDAQRNDSNRIVQMREVTEILSKQPYPVIVAGDMNASAGGPVIQQLDAHFSRTCNDCAPTIPVEKPRRCIDFIAYSKGKFSVISHEVIKETYASDHLPVKSILQPAF
ncbi:endonuclease/exonuclease/phosphatase family protein [Chitinophaga caseinilytica]|uniref:Endonuclease/exonuclease/phosphatase family protein n=1 Tax=Chitinophaga caseinilytica TaxID=2267521 RepID=A0ABZ2Z6J7_9BACT